MVTALCIILSSLYPLFFWVIFSHQTSCSWHFTLWVSHEAFGIVSIWFTSVLSAILGVIPQRQRDPNVWIWKCLNNTMGRDSAWSSRDLNSNSRALCSHLSQLQSKKIASMNFLRSFLEKYLWLCCAKFFYPKIVIVPKWRRIEWGNTRRE